MISFFTSGLGASGGEVLGQRVEASDPQRMDSRDRKAGLNRPPPLWSVLAGQVRGEEEVRTEHLPSRGLTGGPGQLQPHVGPSALSVQTRVLF